MFNYFFNWLAFSNLAGVIKDLIVVIIVYCNGPVPTAFNFTGVFVMLIYRTAIFAIVWAGECTMSFLDRCGVFILRINFKIFSYFIVQNLQNLIWVVRDQYLARNRL